MPQDCYGPEKRASGHEIYHLQILTQFAFELGINWLPKIVFFMFTDAILCIWYIILVWNIIDSRSKHARPEIVFSKQLRTLFSSTYLHNEYVYLIVLNALFEALRY